MTAKDRTKVSFAEAEGAAKFPAILQWGEIDQRLRSLLWTATFVFFEQHFRDHPTRTPGWHLKDPAGSMMVQEFLLRRHLFITDYEQYHYSKESFYESWSEFFKKRNYVEILDFLTFLIRLEGCPDNFAKSVAEALDQPFSPYRLEVKTRAILPAVSEVEGDALQKNITAVFSSSFRGSQSHLQAALDEFGRSAYRDSVRESINAVESAIRDFTGDKNAVLSKAIRELNKSGHIHRALADAFEKLYAYTSDEDGIRHSLVLSENDSVGFDEALFFLSACAAFVGFLSRKREKLSV